MTRKLFIPFLAVVFLLAGSTAMQAQNTNPVAQPQQKKIEVSDSELQTFAKVMQEVRKEQKSSQGVMLKAIKDNGLKVKRYQEIARAKRKGQNVEMTSKEKKAYQAVQQVMKKEQQKMRKKMNSILKNYSMKRRRYIQISRALQRDKQLQKRLQEMRQK